MAKASATPKTTEPTLPKNWHEVLMITRETLPWREEAGGVLVLGDAFETAPREVVEVQAVVVDKPLPNPKPMAIPADTDTPEQAYGRLVHSALQGLPLGASTPLTVQAQKDAAAVRAAHPWIWGKGSRAEVALVLPNGQIGLTDRLVPHNGAWWVIDFKTGTPQNPVPANYVAQLQGYAQALQASLPDACIKTAIVWVANAQLAETAWNG